MWWAVRTGAWELNGHDDHGGRNRRKAGAAPRASSGLSHPPGAIVIGSSGPSASGVAACAAPTWHIPSPSCLGFAGLEGRLE